jgi:hypothetical protein
VSLSERLEGRWRKSHLGIPIGTARDKPVIVIRHPTPLGRGKDSFSFVNVTASPCEAPRDRNEAVASTSFTRAYGRLYLPRTVVTTQPSFAACATVNMSAMSVPRRFDSWAHHQSSVDAPDTRNMVATHLLELGEMAGGQEAVESAPAYPNATACIRAQASTRRPYPRQDT